MCKPSISKVCCIWTNGPYSGNCFVSGRLPFLH